MSAAPVLPSPTDEDKNSPSVSPTPWGFLISIALIALLAEMAYAVINNSTLPVYVKYGLGLPKLVGAAVASFLLAEALLNGPTGLLADRLGRRTLMVAGPMISVGTCILTALLRVPHHGPERALAISALILLRFLDGAGAAALWPAVFASIGDRVSSERQSAAMGVLNVSYMMGIAFGPYVGGDLNDFYAHRLSLDLNDPLRYVPSFVLAGAAFLITAIVGFIIAPSKNEQKRAESAPAAATGHEGGAITLDALIAALRQIPMLVLLAVVLFFGIGLIAPNVKLYALERLNVSEKGFGQLLIWPALIVGALAVPLGRLGDIWGRAVAIRVGCGIAAASLWTLLFFESEMALEIIGTLLGIGFVLAFPAYLAYLSEVGGDKARGSVIGAVKTFQGIGMLLGAVIGSPLYQKAYLSPFVGAAILMTSGFLIALCGVRNPKPSPSAPLPSS